MKTARITRARTTTPPTTPPTMIPIGGVPELSSLREGPTVLVCVGIPVGVLSKEAVGYGNPSVADEVTKVRGASLEVVGNLLVGIIVM